MILIGIFLVARVLFTWEIKFLKSVLYLKAVQALDQVRWPRLGFPRAWALPLKDLIR